MPPASLGSAHYITLLLLSMSRNETPRPPVEISPAPSFFLPLPRHTPIRPLVICTGGFTPPSSCALRFVSAGGACPDLVGVPAIFPWIL